MSRFRGRHEADGALAAASESSTQRSVEELLTLEPLSGDARNGLTTSQVGMASSPLKRSAYKHHSWRILKVMSGNWELVNAYQAQISAMQPGCSYGVSKTSSACLTFLR